MIVERCPLCEYPDSRPFAAHADQAATLHYRDCPRCGLVFQSPRMDPEQLQSFYTASYRLLMQGEEGPTEKDRRVQAGRARHLVDFTCSVLNEVGSHLDIGSSAGSLLTAFHSAFGSSGVGVEPGEAYRAFSRARGLNVYADLESLQVDGRGPFDLISLIHVVEHLPDPVDYLRELRNKWLREGGYLLLETPNLFGHLCFEVAHLSAFAPSTLRYLLACAGFSVEAMKVHGAPRSRLLPLYITILARAAGPPAREPVPPSARAWRLRRRLGLARNRLLTALLPGWTWLPWPALDAEEGAGG